MNKIQDIAQRLADVKHEISQMGKGAIYELFKDFFAKNPEITGIRWYQYTPFFNDGAVCTFSVYSDYLSLRDANNNWEDDCGHVEASRILGQVPDEIMLAMFGDHAEVVMLNTGEIEVGDFEHE
jgi:hypothetical protein